MNKRVLFLITLLILLSANISFADNANASGFWSLDSTLSPMTLHIVTVTTYPGGSHTDISDEVMNDPSASFVLEVSQSIGGALSGSSSREGFSNALSGTVSGNSITFTYTSTLTAPSLTSTQTMVGSGTISDKTINGTLTYSYTQDMQISMGSTTVSSTSTGSTTGSFTVTIMRIDLDTFLTSYPVGSIDEPVATFAWIGFPEEKVARYEYSLDGSPKVSTTNTSVTLSGLSETEHTFSVAAVDLLGNVDSTPATCTFTVRRRWSGQPNLEESNRGSQPDKSTADPVNFVTGNMYIITQDLALPGRGPDFKFSRAYNGLNKNNGPLGYGWTHSYNVSLAIDIATGLGKITDEEGRGYLFGLNSDGSATAQRGEYSRLVNNVSNITWRKKDGTEYLFDSSYRLTSIKDRNANQITLEYDAKACLVKITDTAGRQVTLSYDTQNRLVSLNYPTGSHFDYFYDSSGNLVKVADPKGENTFYEYDTNHNLTKKTDAKGNAVSFTYDSSNRCISSSGDNNYGLTRLAYDPANKKTTVTDSKGKTTTHYYSDDFEVTKSIDSTGKEALSNWDANFNLISRSDELGRTTTMEYDAMGNISKITDPLGNSSVFIYEPNFSLLTSATDAKGNIITYNYDAKGNLLGVRDALGNSTTYTNNSYGQVSSATNALGKTSSFTYDAQGNLTSSSDALGNAATFKYDVLGNLSEATDPKGNTTKYSYDSLNQPTQITYPDSSIVSYTYDEVGNRTSVTDANSRTTSYTYDQNNKVTSSIDPLGNTTRFAYDTEGNLITVTDQNGRQTHYTYDSLNRLTEQEDALGNKVKFEYDAVGNLTKKTDAKGQIISYEYDSLSRLKKIIYPTGSPVTFAYDSLGRRTSMVDSRGTTNYTYDALSRVLSVDGPSANDTVRYTYDAVSNRAIMIDPDTKITRYAYDALNRLSSITDSSGKVTNYTYDSLGNLINNTYPNGLKTVNTYDTLNRLTKLTQQKSTSPFTKLNEFTYTYDAAGRRKTYQALDGSLINYTYDAAGRLSQEAKTSPNPYQISYEYDSSGNRTRMLKNSLTHAYSYNDLNQLTEENISSASARTTKITVSGRMLNSSTIRSITVNNIPASFDNPKFVCYNVPLTAGSNTLTIRALNSAGATLATKVMHITYTPTTRINYTYDLNGNLAKRQSNVKTSNYNFDYDNRLTKINSSGKETLFQYDGEGKRISSQGLSPQGTVPDIRYIYDGLNVSLERNASGTTTASYLRNPNQPGGIGGLVRGLSPQGTVPEQYYLYNGQNSVTNLTNTTGVSTNSYDYDSFGNIITQSGTSSNSYRYSTKELDSTGLIYFGARYYDPRIGRFITPDPLGIVDGPNLYLYVNNDPVNWIDPWGLCKYLEGEIVGVPFWQDPMIIGPLTVATAVTTGPAVIPWVLENAVPWLVPINLMLSPMTSVRMPPGSGTAIKQFLERSAPIIEMIITDSRRRGWPF